MTPWSHGSHHPAPGSTATGPHLDAATEAEREEQRLFEDIEAWLDSPVGRAPGALQQRLEQADGRGRALERAFLPLRLAGHRDLEGHHDEALRLWRQAKSILDRIGLDSGRAVSRTLLRALHALRGEFDAATECLGPALSLARADRALYMVKAGGRDRQAEA